jgi:hypothetical protein
VGAVAAALATLRRCHAGLAGDVTPEERGRLLALHDEALRLLEEGSDRRRLSTRALAARVATLERQLADRTPGERIAIIRERLGISRRRFYQLRSANNAALAAATVQP